ncbi:MAG: restriction endonuclease subunit S [Xanthomonadales bacterium]|nr:restriction endonuclease subunit S [Xanthomonadales bacterium]
MSIGDLVDRGHARLQTGPFGSQLHKHDYTDEGIPVIPTEAIGRGRIVADAALPLVSETKAAELSRHRLMLGDILFARRGIQATGLSTIVDEEHVGSICGTGALLLRVNPNAVDPKFLAAYLSTTEVFGWLRSNAVGAVMPNLNTSIISRLRVPMPPIEVQAAVGQFTACLDDRIDNLRQTNATLEAIAQALFKSWFVDFDPVHAKAEGHEPEGMDAATAVLFPSEFEESQLGPIPKGWSIAGLGKISKNVREQAKPENLDPSTPYIGLEHMPKKSIALTDQGSAEGLASGKFWYRANDILFGKLRPYFHKVGVATSAGVCSTDILVVRPVSPQWLGYTTMQFSSHAVISYATQLSNGAKMPRTNWSDLAKFRVALPPATILEAFDNVVGPMIARIHANITIASSLKKTRDNLLPRLISCKLHASEAETLKFLGCGNASK